MNKRVFIGSSREALDIANSVRDYLESTNFFDCTVWCDDFFELSESTFHNLIRKSITFNYAVFIAASDDIIIRKSNSTRKLSARDNIYLELGLFTGVLGHSHVYVLKHSDCSLATDLLGITCVEYDNDLLHNDFVKQSVFSKLSSKMLSESRIHRMSLRPSTCLAKGYFDNFIVPTVNAFFGSATLLIDGFEYSLSGFSVSINIVVPDVIDQDISSWFTIFKHVNSLADASIKTQSRVFGVLVDMAALNSQNLVIYDIPVTLKTSFSTIDMLVGYGDHFGNSEDQILVKSMEIDDFCKSLSIMVNNNSCSKSMVTISRLRDFKIPHTERRTQ